MASDFPIIFHLCNAKGGVISKYVTMSSLGPSSTGTFALVVILEMWSFRRNGLCRCQPFSCFYIFELYRSHHLDPLYLGQFSIKALAHV